MKKRTALEIFKPRPSNGSRFNQCTASIKLAAYFQNKSSEFAREGTAAHKMGEISLTTSAPADKIAGMTYNISDIADKPDPWTFDDDMAGNVQEYLDYVERFAPKVCRVLGKTFWVEQKLDMGFLWEGMDGTADALYFDALENELHVFDLKYGMGVLVEAEGNTQLPIYGAAALRLNPIFAGCTVHVHIIQPRKNWAQKATFQPDELNAFVDKVKANLKKAFSGSPEISAGEHCKFCPAKPICPAYISPEYGELLDVEALIMGDIPIDLSTLKPDKLGELMKKAGLVEQWAKQFQTFALNWMANGGEIEGYKVVQGRAGHRKWASESEAASVLGAKFGQQIYETTLASPTKLEKIVGKKAFAEYDSLVMRGEGKPSIVPISDARPAYKSAPMFDIYED
jgi:hypothetical protein